MPRYKSKEFDIPFYERSTESYRLKIKVDKTISDDASTLKNKAVEYYITHYFPEFYAYLFNPSAFDEFENADLDVAAALKIEIKNATLAHSQYETAPPSSKKIAVFSLRYDIDGKRRQLENNGQFPSFEENLIFFNNQNEIGSTNSQSTFTVGTLGETNNLLNNGLRTFDTQYQGFEGQISLNVDFGSLQTSAQKILNLLVSVLAEQLKTSSPSYDFGEADTITLFFGKKNNKLDITGMEYLLLENSIQSQPMKIGYFSIVQYNRLLQDPLTLALLKNYQSILGSVQSSANTNSSYSFFDFLSDPAIGDALGEDPTMLDFNPQPKKDLQNILISIASDYGLIETNNTEELEKGFTTALTSTELKKLKNQE